jgi:hypothetical protein
VAINAAHLVFVTVADGDAFSHQKGPILDTSEQYFAATSM